MNDVNDFSQYAFYALTLTNTSVLKSLIESIKDIIPDINLHVTKNNLKILQSDVGRTILAHLILDADKFDSYHCKEPLTIGINLQNLNKLIKSVSSNDMIALYVKNDDKDNLYIKIIGPKKNYTISKLNLLDLHDETHGIPGQEFQQTIQIKTSDLQRTLRDMKNIGATEIQITAKENYLQFYSKGDFAEKETNFTGDVDGIYFSKSEKIDNKNFHVSSTFSLESLALFSKCSTFSPDVIIYLKPDYPLVLAFNVGSLGELKLCLVHHH